MTDCLVSLCHAINLEIEEMSNSQQSKQPQRSSHFCSVEINSVLTKAHNNYY